VLLLVVGVCVGFPLKVKQNGKFSEVKREIQEIHRRGGMRREGEEHVALLVRQVSTVVDPNFVPPHAPVRVLPPLLQRQIQQQPPPPPPPQQQPNPYPWDDADEPADDGANGGAAAYGDAEGDNTGYGDAGEGTDPTTGDDTTGNDEPPPPGGDGEWHHHHHGEEGEYHHHHEGGDSHHTHDEGDEHHNNHNDHDGDHNDGNANDAQHEEFLPLYCVNLQSDAEKINCLVEAVSRLNNQVAYISWDKERRHPIIGWLLFFGVVFLVCRLCKRRCRLQQQWRTHLPHHVSPQAYPHAYRPVPVNPPVFQPNQYAAPVPIPADGNPLYNVPFPETPSGPVYYYPVKTPQ